MAMKRTTVPVAVGTGQLVTSPRKIREAALAEADQDEPTSGLVIDQRREVLSTAGFLSRDPNQYVADIHNLWHRAQESFIAIGQRLVAVREIIEERLRTDPS